MFRILAPTAILGYGFPRASFDAALKAYPMDLIAVDAGSIDPGPYYLATRTSFTGLSQVVRDLRIMVEGFVAQRYEQGLPCKLVVGSAGGCGTDNQVSILAEEVLRMLREIGGRDVVAATAVATVTSELRDPALLMRRPLIPLGPMPWGHEAVAAATAAGAGSSSTVVAQMGLEPIICALEHADIVICGRAYDPAVFAAEPVRCGFPAAAALHAAKVLECGAIATVPGSGSDCLVAELTRDGTATIWAPNNKRLATPLSVAAHTLYEKSHPHYFGLPSGVLNTTRTTFTAKAQSCEISGTTLARVAPAVKLEGATVRGHRAVRLIVVPEEERDAFSAQNSFAGFVYGINGVESEPVDAAAQEQELGIVVSVVGEELDHSKSHLALLRATLLHWGFEGRKATAGNLAFPFSPSDLTSAGGEVLTVCGTRDPAFIANYKGILRDAEAYVATLSPAEGLTVRFVPCGLPGMPLLIVEEAVAPTPDQAEAALDPSASLSALEEWVCSGGMAADFTLHHLVDVDAELMRGLFQIRILNGETGASSTVEARLVQWGSGPVVSQAEATADWHASALQPQGARATGQQLGELARVVRSKNAGVNELTFDVIFDNEDSYAAAAQSQERVQAMLGRPVLGVYRDDRSLAVKITCDRVLLAGCAGDRDVYGAQQHRRLLGLLL